MNKDRKNDFDRLQEASWSTAGLKPTTMENQKKEQDVVMTSEYLNCIKSKCSKEKCCMMTIEQESGTEKCLTENCPVSNCYKRRNLLSSAVSCTAVCTASPTDLIPTEMDDPKEYPVAPFVLNQDKVESVGLNSGSLELTFTDFVLPGKNGFDFALTRRYNSSWSNQKELTPKFEIKGRYTWCIRLGCKCNNQTTSREVDVSCTIYDKLREYRNAEEAKAAAEDAWDYWERDSYHETNSIDVVNGGEHQFTINEVKDIYYTTYDIRKKIETPKTFISDTRPNNHLTDTYGLGLGWGFGFPSIEVVGEEFNSRNKVKYYNFLHLGDGRAYRLENKQLGENQLKEYKLKDLEFLKASSKIADQEYHFLLKYQDGKRAYFYQESKNYIKLVAMVDRFDNTILFNLNTGGGGTVTDTLGRTITLSKAAIAGGYTLTWTLPDASSIIYTVENGLLTKVKDQAGRVTIYGYGNYPVGAEMAFRKGKVRRSYKGDEFSDTAVEIPYMPLTDVTYPTGAKSKYIYEFFDNFRIGLLQGTQGMLLLRRRADFEGDENSKNLRDYHYRANWKNHRDEKGKENIYDARAYLMQTTVTSGERQEEYSFGYQMPMRTQTTKLNGVTSCVRNLEYEYDLLPKKETVKRMQGGKILVSESTWSYDEKGNMLTQKLPLQDTVSMEYDGEYGLLISKRYKKDANTEIAEIYALTDTMKAVEWKRVINNDITKEITEYKYDSIGNLIKERRCADVSSENPPSSNDDRVTEYSYANTNPALDSSKYDGVFLTKKSISGVIDVDGNSLASVTEQQMYDAHGRLLKKTDAAEHSTWYEYDALGRIKKEIYPKNNPSDFSEPQYSKQTQYDDAANHIIITNENGQKKRMEYTPLGRIKRVYALEPETLLFDYEYDAQSRLTAEYAYSTDGVAKTAYTYDARDRILSKCITGQGMKDYWERYEYDDAFDPVRQYKMEKKQIIDEALSSTIVTTGLKDAAGRTREEKTGDSTTLTDYDNVGNATLQTDPNGNTVAWEYDYAGRVVSETRKTETGSVTAYTQYDTLGNKFRSTDFRGTRTFYWHDVLGRLKEQISGILGWEKAVTRYRYDAVGNILRQSVLCDKTTAVPVWRETFYTYDSRGRLVETVSGNGAEQSRTRYEYDPAGNQTALYVGMSGSSTAGAQKTTYTYDRFGNTTSVTDPIGNGPNPAEPARRTEHFTYDAYGRLRQKQDRNGVVTTYTYDCLGRVLRETAADTPAAFRAYRYTSAGQKAAEENEQLSVSYMYDDHGRLISQTELCLRGAANRVEKRYSYDAYGNRTSFTLDKDGVRQLTLSYRYDEQNRLIEVWKGAVQSGLRLASYTYDANGNRAQLSYPQSGITVTYTYNDANLVTELRNEKDGVHRSSYHYSYLLDGNQRQKVSRVAGKPDKTVNYSYDSQGRLIREQEQGGGSIAYKYDRFSNRARMTVTDKSGKQTIATDYEYDMRNRLQKETKTTGETTEVLTYRCDYNGNQVHRQWERFSPVPEKKTPGRVGFAAGKGKETVVVLEQREYNGFNELVYLYRDGYETRYAYRPDGLRHKKLFADGTSTTHIWDGQSIAAEYAGSGNITARYLRGMNLIAREQDSRLQYYLYNAHGDVIQRTDENGTALKGYDYDAFGNEQAPEPLDANPFRYCGEYYDREAETIYLRARSYDARTGRFTREDPVRDGLNWYTYCGGNPVGRIDPSGASWEDFWDDASAYWRDFVASQNMRWEDLINAPSFLHFSDWMTYGMLGANQERYDRAEQTGSAYEYANWLFSGTPDMIQGALNPEKPLSFDHWMNSLGTATLVYGGYKGAQTGQTGTSLSTSNFKGGIYSKQEMVAPSELIPTHKLTMGRNRFQIFVQQIKIEGIQQNIMYVEYNGGMYVVDGHHRLAAARILRLNAVPVQKTNLPFAGYVTIDDLFWME